jgi:hypothetical protein
MKGFRTVKLALLGMVVFRGAEMAQDVVYSFTTIDVPGSLSTSATGINSSGQIVGTAGNNGVFYSDGSFATIAVADDTITVAYGIDDSSQIVGSFFDAFGEHGFFYSGGIFNTIDYPGTTGSTIVQGINNGDQIVGSAGRPGFLYSGGSFSAIEVPGAVRTVPTGINDSGQIVGWFIDTSRIYHGFLDNSGSFTTIDFPGSRFTQAHGINNNGQIVLDFLGTDGYDHAILDDGGTFTTINVPGAIYTLAEGINDRGEIVGYFRDAAGLHGFLATPVAAIPEPVLARSSRMFARSVCHGLPLETRIRFCSWGSYVRSVPANRGLKNGTAGSISGFTCLTRDHSAGGPEI